ncbi:hypothetical protein [Flavobacterium sp. UBA6135]|uniref:hypothetical protein n=1 Tax=Flavobacterium sp. UBA6135 TaxID=1946553 RepID=UPI0025B87247|nr:hypothetical protein [Flavobacterium sp. UBA6135]
MNKNVAVMLASLLLLSPLFGLLLYFFEKEMTAKEIVLQSLIFGFLMGLAELFVFEKIRNRYKKPKITDENNKENLK